MQAHLESNYLEAYQGDLIHKILEHCDLWHDSTATVELIGPNCAELVLMIIASLAWWWMCNVG